MSCCFIELRALLLGFFILFTRALSLRVVATVSSRASSCLMNCRGTPTFLAAFSQIRSMSSKSSVMAIQSLILTWFRNCLMAADISSQRLSFSERTTRFSWSSSELSRSRKAALMASGLARTIGRSSVVVGRRGSTTTG